MLNKTESLQAALDSVGQDSGVVAAETAGQAPSVMVTVGPGIADTPVAIDISVGVGQAANGIAGVVISGLPDGAFLESFAGGLLLPRQDGSYELDAGSLSGLTMMPPENFNGVLSDLSIVVTTHDGGTSAPVPFTVTIDPVYEMSAPDSGDGSVLSTGESVAAGVDLLSKRDIDDPADSVIFEVTGLPEFGTLYRGEDALSLGGTFTQFDIDNGLLTYQAVDQALAPGTYLSGISPEGHRYDPIDSWDGVGIYAFAAGGAPHSGSEGSLDLTAADHTLLSFTPAGVSGDVLVIDLFANVSEARLTVVAPIDGGGAVRGTWEAYNALGQQVGDGIVDGDTAVAGGNDAATVAVTGTDGQEVRYVAFRADAESPAEGGGILVRNIEYDVIASLESDSFTFRAGDGIDLTLAADTETVGPGYTVVDGEAVFNILISDLAA